MIQRRGWSLDLIKGDWRSGEEKERRGWRKGLRGGDSAEAGE